MIKIFLTTGCELYQLTCGNSVLVELPACNTEILDSLHSTF